MHAIKANIIKIYWGESKHAGEIQITPLSCYYYNIREIGVILYQDAVQRPGLFSTAEYYSGAHIASAPTMQEALDKCTEVLNAQDYDALQNKIAGHLAKTGYANKPEDLQCSWCGERHFGGPENCKQ